MAGKDVQGFRSVAINDNIFFTALILDCLQGIDGAATIRTRAANYLLAQRSKDWTWNYWERGSTSRPYPDDLDDTACAIAGISGHDASLLSSVDQAALARVLIRSETQPGGPYVTWCMPPDSIQWRDIDPAVNANIGHMLARLGVHSQPLEDYLSGCISSGALTSPYYVGTVPVLYFMARWYRGPQHERLARLVLDRHDSSNSPLHRAMLIMAACNLGYGDKIDKQRIRDLLRLQHDDGWVANALYLEPPEDGSQRYAGSPELTTAFVVEALNAYLKLQTDLGRQAAKASSGLEEIHTIETNRIVAQGRREIVNIAGVIRQALGRRIRASVLQELNRGSIQGWVAYTIYDGLVDGDLGLNYLGAANVAMRYSLQHFSRALPGSISFARFADKAFTCMDSASTWEVIEARDSASLPNYTNTGQLANRSWGHVIAPTGVLMATGFELGSREMKNFHNFMRHYIIAKQLCDDAHDWREDLARGHMSAVVVMLLKGCNDSSADMRQLHFWQKTIFEVNVRVRYHLRKAQYYLDACYFFCDKTELQSWLEGVEAVCLRVEAGHQAASQFIQTFTMPDLVE